MGASKPGRRRGVWLALLVCWVAVIWGHSLVAGPESSRESGVFVTLLRPLFLAVGVADEDLMSFFVRKCAHFTEYAVLGMLVVRNVALWWNTTRRRSWVMVPGAAAVPFVDEWIQLSVPGRAGMASDVLLDLAGLCCGLLVALLLRRIFQSR